MDYAKTLADVSGYFEAYANQAQLVNDLVGRIPA